MFPAIFPHHPFLTKRYQYSQTVIQRIRRHMEAAVPHASLSIVAVGSFGRGELSDVSDLDFFLLHEGDTDEAKLNGLLQRLQREVTPYTAASENDPEKYSQAAVCSYDQISLEANGKQDSYTALTRRMLLLLEGRPLCGELFFHQCRQQLLRHYIKPGDSANGLARYLLNDIVRYYRTLMANFEHQVTVLGKPWGLRNIKLHFSRKLLFIGGVVLVAQTSHLPSQEKVARIEHLLHLTPLQRLQSIGQDNPSTVFLLNHYQHFLSTISSARNRQLLDQVNRSNCQQSSLYLQLRELSEVFSLELERWIRHQYPAHPIHHALLF
ncbi:MAG: nucleotidyltransferase domain-containing protein [Pseudomonas sp.]|uniref:nucleotidyltransferase domain-containing protein n=1 Tax=Pseudomonas sp. TaxID=306 RepID=UPI003D0ACFFA